MLVDAPVVGVIGPLRLDVEERHLFVEQAAITGFGQVPDEGVRYPRGRVHVHAHVMAGTRTAFILANGPAVGGLIAKCVE